MYDSFRKINDYYYSGRSGLKAWRKERLRRSAGGRFLITESFFHHHNPLYGEREPWAWIVERYKPIFDYLDGKRLKRVAEIGCAYGLSTWLLTDIADEVWGIDINGDAIEIAQSIFPEVRFVAGDVKKVMEEIDQRFDVIIDCYGPWNEIMSVAPRYSDLWLHVGRPPKKGKHLAEWAKRITGRSLSYNCTAMGPDQRGVSWTYPRYFFTRQYLRDLYQSIIARRRAA